MSSSLPPPAAGYAECVVTQEGAAIKCRYPTDHTPKYLDTLIAPNNLPNLLLVVITAGGIAVAIWTVLTVKRQTKATEDAAIATRDSVVLQEAAYEAWVGLYNWQSRVEPSIYGRAISNLIIEVDIVNKSAYPLTLLGGKLMYGRHPDRKSCSVWSGMLMVPEDPLSTKIEIRLSPEEFQDYVKESHMLVLSGWVQYKSVIGRVRIQEFGGLVRPRPSYTTFQHLSAFTPSRDSSPELTEEEGKSY